MTKIKNIKVGGTTYPLQDKDLTEQVNVVAEVVSQALNDLQEDNRQKEHVVCICRSVQGSVSQMTNLSRSGITLHVKIFDKNSLEEWEETYSVPNTGHIEFDVPYGCIYEVWTTKASMGASFRVSYTACQPYVRKIRLWNLSVGVFKFGFKNMYCESDDGWYCNFPAITTDGSYNIEDIDVDFPSEYDYEMFEGCPATMDPNDYDIYADEMYEYGILISKADCSFLINNALNKAPETKYWSKQAYNKSVPGLHEFYSIAEDYTCAQNMAKADYDGSLNTDKITDALIDCPAAMFACQSPDYVFQTYLPAAGELKLLYDNKSAYNNIQADYTDVPAIDTNWYWSSSAYSPYYSWIVNMHNGNVSNFTRYFNDCCVLAFSAFLYNY